MKKLLLALVLLVSTFSFGQNFPGEDVALLLNKEVKVKDISLSLQKYGYNGFYKDENLKTKFGCCDSYNSKYSSLVNKVFTVTEYKEFINVIGVRRFKLSLNNSETGVIYFDYDPKYDHTFPFEVIGGLTFPENFYCDKITKSIDKFTNEVKYSLTHKNIELEKIIKDKDTVFYLNIKSTSTYLSVENYGLTLLLENNKKIEKPSAKINVTTNRDGYVYSVFVRLTNEDINLLLNNQITDSRLYIFDNNYKDGNIIQEYLKCLVK